MNKFYYTYIIYCTNPNSSMYGCIYYGKHTTSNLLDGYITSGKKIKNYINKYPNDYYRKILGLYNSQEELNKAEYNLIHPHLGKKYCLNLTEGGNGARPDNTYHLNHPHSEETKKILRIISLGNKNASGKRTEEQKENIRNGWKKGHTEETFKKQANSLKKYYKDPTNRKKCSERSKKLWQDPEFRKRTCAAHTRIITEEELEKRSRSMKGKNKGKHKVWDNKELNIYHMEY